MTSNQHERGPIRAYSASQHDPFINASEQLDGIALIDLTADDELDHGRLQQALRVNKSLRNYDLDADHKSVKGVPIAGKFYEVGQFVELRELVDPHGIEFIEINSIHVHKQTDDVIIRGLPYARTRNLYGSLPRKQNEVCLVLEIDVDDARPDENQALCEIGSEDILRRRILTKTNKSFPNCRFDEVVYATSKQKEEEAPLACRWKMRNEYKDVSQRRAGRFEGQALEHLSERDSHKIKKRNLGADNDRAREWRRDTVSGGPTLFKTEFIGNDSGDGEPTCVHKYSYAEVAAGAGGGSRGAEMASFKVVWATESCRHASQTYRANFPNAELYEMEIPKFTGDKTQLVVDVLRIPSSALSAAGDDSKCVQQICTDLLNKTLARFVLMDLPTSMMSERNTPFLNAIKLSFTHAGYSIKSKIVHMVEYGLPQIRNRLILIGAAPGEALPSWPTATHSSDPTEDQRPFMTEEDAISGLTPELHSLHDPDAMKVMDCVVRDARKPMDTPINGNGSTYHHPDGERDHTLRERACLQGFPTYHQFEGYYIKKQIGNAFPPSVAMAFYQHIRQHMEEFDGVQPGLTESGEPAGDPVTSGLEITTESTIESTVHDEQPNDPNGPLDVIMPVFSQDSRSNGDSVRSPFRQQKGAAFSTPALLMSPASPSPRLTMSPKVESDERPRSSLSRTPSSAWELPTPSTDGRFVSRKQTADPQLKRERDQFEEPHSDGDDDDSPQALETPSKRPRISGAVHESESASSRTCSITSDGAAVHAEDVPIPNEADELRGSGPDDEWLANQARDL